MENKRKVSLLIPYKLKDNLVMVFLQKREQNRLRAPGRFGLFGGAIEEGENPEQALVREIKEELSITIANYKYLDHYEFRTYIPDVYILEVDDKFEGQIKIEEGEYGKWFSEEEIKKEEKLSQEDKFIFKDFYKFIKNEKLV